MKLSELIFWVIILVMSVDGSKEFIITLVHGPDAVKQQNVKEPTKSDELKSDW